MGAAGDWWDQDYEWKPAIMVDDVVVARAANQLIERYGDRAGMEASVRSNQAQKERDQFNYELWQRVALAVAKLPQPKPTNSKIIN